MLLEELSIGTTNIIDDVATSVEAKEPPTIDVNDNDSSTTTSPDIELITNVEETTKTDFAAESSTQSSADEADGETDDEDNEEEKKDKDVDKSEENSQESSIETESPEEDVTSAKQQKLSSSDPEVEKNVVELITEASPSGVGASPVIKDVEMRTSTRLSGSGGDTTTSSQGGVGTLDGFDSDSGVSTISSCALPTFSDDGESTAASGCVSPDNEVMDAMTVKVVYGGHDILDLSGTLKTRPWDLQFTQLPLMNLAMFWQNRSQYHRLGNFGREEYKQLCCIECEFQYPVPN